MEKIVVRVPSTCSDIIMGSDAFGLTFARYCTVIVEEETDHWRVNHALGNNIPHNEDNLIVQTILKTNDTIHPHQITIMSDIPQNQEVGSKNAMIIAGIKIANVLGKMNLSLDDQIKIGYKLNHNLSKVTAAILGGLTIADINNDQVTAINAKIPVMSALVVANKQINLNDYKLPDKVNLRDELKISSISSVFTAALMDDEWSKAAMVIEENPFFSNIEKENLDKLDWVKDNAHSLGIYGTFMLTNSTVITLGNESALSKLQDYLNNDFQNEYDIKIIPISNNGASIHGE